MLALRLARCLSGRSPRAPRISRSEAVGRVHRIGELQTVKAVLRAASRDHQDRMGPAEVGACWNTLGKLTRHSRDQRACLLDALRARPALDPLIKLTRRELEAMQPGSPALGRTIAVTAHGLATVAKHTRFALGAQLWDFLATRGIQEYGAFTPQGLSNTAWAFATAGHASPELFEAVARAAVPRLGEFKPQGLANTAWAFAVADAPCAGLLFSGAGFTSRCASVTHFPAAELGQLHQWELWRIECGEVWPSLSTALAEQSHPWSHRHSKELRRQLQPRALGCLRLRGGLGGRG